MPQPVNTLVAHAGSEAEARPTNGGLWMQARCGDGRSKDVGAPMALLSPSLVVAELNSSNTDVGQAPKTGTSSVNKARVRRAV